MTFRETEYPDLLGTVRRIHAAERSNPRRAVEWVEAFLDLHDRISLYPGLAVSMAMEIAANGTIDRTVLDRKWPSLVFPPKGPAARPRRRSRTRR